MNLPYVLLKGRKNEVVERRHMTYTEHLTLNESLPKKQSIAWIFSMINATEEEIKYWRSLFVQIDYPAIASGAK